MDSGWLVSSNWGDEEWWAVGREIFLFVVVAVAVRQSSGRFR